MIALLSLAVNAAAPTESPEANAVLNRWLEAQAQVQTWSASFVQTRILKALKDPLTTAGKVWFAAPDRFRWELGDPAQTIALRQRNNLYVVYPRLKLVEKFALNEAGTWRDALALLDAGFPRTEADLRQQYVILSQITTGEAAEIQLAPKSPQARKMMRRITLRFRLPSFDLVATELTFADGSSMKSVFSDTRLNLVVPDEVFSVPASAEYKLVEPLKQSR